MANRHIAVRTGLLAAALCLATVGCTASGSQDTSSTSTEPDRVAMEADLERLAEETADFDLVRAVVAATSDDVLLERYHEADRDTSWNVHGVTGAVISTLVGVAVDEGLIAGPDATLAELLPTQAEAMPPRIARTTLRQLLTMTAGFPSGRDFTTADDWVRSIVQKPEGPPGSDFAYSQATAHLLAAIVARAGQVSVLDFARAQLFDPLGIETRPAMQGPAGIGRTPEFRRAQFAWTRDPQGVHAGWNGIKLRPRDLVALGRLVLAEGSTTVSRSCPRHGSTTPPHPRSRSPALATATATCGGPTSWTGRTPRSPRARGASCSWSSPRATWWWSLRAGASPHRRSWTSWRRRS